MQMRIVSVKYSYCAEPWSAQTPNTTHFTPIAFLWSLPYMTNGIHVKIQLLFEIVGRTCAIQSLHINTHRLTLATDPGFEWTLCSRTAKHNNAQSLPSTPPPQPTQPGLLLRTGNRWSKCLVCCVCVMKTIKWWTTWLRNGHRHITYMFGRA